jgi:hypothetical protein
LKNFIHLIGHRTRDLPATLPRIRLPPQFPLYLTNQLGSVYHDTHYVLATILYTYFSTSYGQTTLCFHKCGRLQAGGASSKTSAIFFPICNETWNISMYFSILSILRFHVNLFSGCPLITMGETFRSQFFHFCKFAASKQERNIRRSMVGCWDSSVGIATNYGLQDQGSTPGSSKRYFSTS